jgi:uncharacterized delta-60 repeat protein
MVSRNRISIIAWLILLPLFSILTARAAGEVDLAFNASAFTASGGRVNVTAVQPDGKYLIGGIFTVVNGAAQYGIARLNADGTPDASFNPPDLYETANFPIGTGAKVNSIAVQPDGKILVGGVFRVPNSTYRIIIRLNTNGSLDTTFNNLSSEIGDNEEVVKIVVRPNGNIYIGGRVDVTNGQATATNLVRLNPNGVFDPTFVFSSGILKDFAVQADEKVLACGGNVGRFNADGSVDNSFTTAVANSGGISRILVLPDGKIVIVGFFTTINGFSSNRIGRLNTDGTIDLTFNTNGAGVGGSPPPPDFQPVAVYDVSVDSSGKIFIGGNFSTYNGVVRSRIAKLNADGTLDTSFASPQLTSAVSDVEALNAGKVLIGGERLASATFDSVLRLNPDGSTETGFSVKIGKSGIVREVLQQPDGKVLIVGAFHLVNNVQRSGLARLNADGTLDTGFVPFFSNLSQLNITAVALQPDGKILVGTEATSTNFGIGVRRLNPDGTQDMSFAITGNGTWQGSKIFDISLLPDGRILVGGFDISNASGTRSQRRLVRLDSNGAQEMSFDPPGLIGNTSYTPIYRVFVQPDGKYLIAGEFTTIGGVGRGRIAQLNSDGTLDMTFNPPGGANGSVFDFDIQTDGKIVLVGNFTGLNGNTNVQKVGRLNADGSLDASFIQASDGVLLAVKIQPDGKILVGGETSFVGGFPHLCLARLNTNGTVDSGFNPVVNRIVWEVNLQSDGKILVGGEFTRVNNVARVSVARLLNAAVPVDNLFDYDGDGKADVSVYRPSTNRWYIFKSSDSTVTETTFGIAGDVPVPADFDGDNKTDIAIFRPSSGDWWSLSSLNGAQIFAHWGANGDIPRPSDFDGDGRTDYVVFRPSDSFWYRISSANGASSNGAFGLAGDKPVTGDFDGDGKSDKAIFRPSTGDWWYQSSLNGAQLAVHWGISTDVPAPADFDGDGKTDFAVYRPSTGVWYVINSSNFSFLIMNFGIAEDKPVPADYDGDGKADIAVFRPSTGIWYQMKTTAGFAAQQFGVSTDIPTENAFVP